MRLLQFEYQGKRSIGVEFTKSGDVFSLTDASNEFPDNMVDFLEGGKALMDAAKRISKASNQRIQRKDIRLLPPVTNPEKIVCVGMNYRDHCIESKTPIPSEPVIFNKFPSAITGPMDPIVIPKISNAVDWEAELAVVIGKDGKNIEVTDAMDHVAAFTVANDVTARDWYRQRNGGQALLGKTFDTFCPLGPVIVTRDSLKDPHKLRIRCTVNGKVMQDSCTDQLIFKTEECVSWISKFCTLRPGDLILTGTPPGAGAWRTPPVYLDAGDVVTCEIEGIGQISNPFVTES